MGEGMHMRSVPLAPSTTTARLQGEGMHMRSGSLALATVLTGLGGEGMHMRSGSLGPANGGHWWRGEGMHMRSGPACSVARRKRNRRVKVVCKLGGMHMRPELPINANILGYLLLHQALISSYVHPATVRVLMQPLR